MEFYKRKTTKTDHKLVRQFLAEFNVKVHFVNKGWSSADSINRLIEIDVRETRSIQELWSIVFHELGHVYCHDNYLYEKYHREGCRVEHSYYHRMGLKIERFVDKKGKELMKAYYPDIPYMKAYNTEDDKVWYKKWLNRCYPL